MKDGKRIDKKTRLNRLRKYLYRLVKLGVSLRQDWFFHIVFGRNESAPMLCEVMNAVLRNVDEPTVKSIKIKNPFTFGSAFNEKDAIVDVAVEDELGAQYDVEMQTCDHVNFRERFVYYLEKIAAGQLAKGDGYDQLRKTVGIIFVDFPIWSEFNLQKIKDLTPELKEKLTSTQFETIKLMSVENGVVFSDCLTLYFIRIPKAGEEFSPNIRDPKLINWLKAFRFPESTSEKEMRRMETVSPELKELRKQMYEVVATKRKRYCIEARRRYLATQNTLIHENARLTEEKEEAIKEKEEAIKEKEEAIKEKERLLGENALLRRQLMEKES